MIWQKEPNSPDEELSLKGFDDFDLKLGDTLRGERATLGKSLLDVQRELRIKANHIAAIENSDLTAFETQGFIAGYVRSYARYLGLDPEAVFDRFVAESGFQSVSGVGREPVTAGPSGLAMSTRKLPAGAESRATEQLVNPRTPFVPSAEGSAFASLDASAVGSTLVLGVLIAGIGYGAWAVLQQVQQVVIVPVDETPGIVAELDPLSDAATTYDDDDTLTADAEVVDRLHRPDALDLPVLVARDGPIFSLDPDQVGALAPPPSGSLASAPSESEPNPFDATDAVAAALRERAVMRERAAERGTRIALAPGLPVDVARLPAETRGAGSPTPDLPAAVVRLPSAAQGTGSAPAAGLPRATVRLPVAEQGIGPALAPGQRTPAETRSPTAVRVTEASAPEVAIFAVRPAWIQVTSASGTIIFEKILEPGEHFTPPRTEEPPLLRAGNSGAVFFAVNGVPYGPAGPGIDVVRDVPLGVSTLTETYAAVDIESDIDLREAVSVAEAQGILDEAN